VIKKLVDEEEEELVNDMSHKNWKEALAYCLSYAEPTKIEEWANKLGDELEKKKDHNSAIICFIVAR